MIPHRIANGVASPPNHKERGGDYLLHWVPGLTAEGRSRSRFLVRRRKPIDCPIIF